jgi:23S rRNA-/tRNA-specific pseudouridylate synthase
VHATEIGHPVVGDTRYAPDLENPAGVRRLFLHAAELSIDHPDTSERCAFSAPLSSALCAAVEQLE